MEPKKCSKQATFILLDKKRINLWGIDRTKKNVGLGCLLSEVSK